MEIKKTNKILLLFLLVAALFNSSWCAEPKNNKPAPNDANVFSVPFSVSSTATFADVDKNGVVDIQENKAYENEKLKIFDLDHDSRLNEAEKAKFSNIDKIISAGGKSLEGLSDKDKQLYKKWRAFILSLIQKAEEKAKNNKPKSASILKCYPDKVCDDPTSPYYGTSGSGENLTATKSTKHGSSQPQSKKNVQAANRSIENNE